MDDRRYAQLVLPHADAMARVATALVGQVYAEDAVQEALLRAWRGWSSLREEAAVRSWLLRITVNVCRNWHASPFGAYQRHTEPFPQTETPTRIQFITDLGPGTTSHTSALDLRRALTLLGEEARDVVLLRYYGGMDASEIGVALDLPPATIRTRLRRALLRLRELLEQHAETKTKDNQLECRLPGTSGAGLA
jgi:RNA polymerase sigma-70 factor (ECF subfamily)